MRNLIEDMAKASTMHPLEMLVAVRSYAADTYMMTTMPVWSPGRLACQGRWPDWLDYDHRWPEAER